MRLTDELRLQIARKIACIVAIGLSLDVEEDNDLFQHLEALTESHLLGNDHDLFEHYLDVRAIERARPKAKMTGKKLFRYFRKRKKYWGREYKKEVRLYK